MRFASRAVARALNAPGALLRAAASLPRRIASMPKAARVGSIVVMLLGCCLAGGYFFWLRDSPLVRVEKVTISGITIKDRDRLAAALTQATQRMTVFDVRTDELLRVAAPWRSVRTIEVHATVPHEVHLEVVEYTPVAVASGPERRPVAVGADGTVLDGFPLNRPLPVLLVSGPVQPPRLAGPDATALLASLACVPPELRSHVAQLRLAGDRGVTITLAHGPDIVLGDAAGCAAKWQAAARVLTDPASAKAGYIDVSVPQRPAAGGFA